MVPLEENRNFANIKLNLYICIIKENLILEYFKSIFYRE